MVYLRWQPEALQAFSDIVDAEKELVADGRHEHNGFCQKLPGAGLWKIHPHGCRLGDTAHGPVMRWRMERDGIAFGLTRRAEPHKTNPSGFVRMTGDFLLAHGSAERAWADVVRWFRELGAEVVEAKLSRVDMCVDLPGVSVVEFMEAYRAGQYVTRTKKSEEWSFATYKAGRKDTGLAMGSGTRMRIYDKAEECRDISLRSWMIHRRWGGVDPDDATRVEFQLRREFLTEHGVSTVEDYFAKRRTLARFLTTRWVRFVQDLDARHTDRAETSQIWRDVQDAFDQWTAGSDDADLSPLPRATVDVDAYAKQIRGLAESAAAKLGMWIDGQDELINFAAELTYGVTEGDTQIGERVMCKMNQTTAPPGRRPAMLLT